MDYAAGVFTFVQFFFAIVIGLYFWNLLKSQQGSKVAVDRESKKEIEKLERMRRISLTEPLSERTRPKSMKEVIGQEEGVKALRAALCGPNPQHVLVYGPPGVGKTAAARLVLEEARSNPASPFKGDAKFIEIDATVARFDERGIADPLIGSVHDPIYQGAGPMGIAGIPQPKPGAVTKAHGGILFIDEIGELHPIQMNKLLKVLEDRKVFLESAYFSSEDPNIPTHIRDIFQNGLPADFRLVGATTRSPEELPPAIRSRCVEVFFRDLHPAEVRRVAEGASANVGMPLGAGAPDVIAKFARNGREAVNIVQIAAGIASGEGRGAIGQEDIEWVVAAGQYAPRPEVRLSDEPQIGVVNGLAVYGPNLGTVIEVEAVATPAKGTRGRIEVTGMIDEEELGGRGRTIHRRSMAACSVQNVLTVLRRTVGLRLDHQDIHVNFPGGMPLDGPSAGVTLAVAITSAVTGRPVPPRLCMTGELSVRGLVKPVGGVAAKVEAAIAAGAEKILVPKENLQEAMKRLPARVIGVERLDEVLGHALVVDRSRKGALVQPQPPGPIVAAPLDSPTGVRPSL